MLFNAFGGWVGFDAFDLVDPLLTQPLLVIAGDEAGSLWQSKELYAKAPGPKELFLIKGATHMDLPDGNGGRGRTPDGAVLHKQPRVCECDPGRKGRCRRMNQI